MDKVNMLLESGKYSDLQSFLRERDGPEIMASFVINVGNRSTFFQNFPQLVHQEFFFGGSGTKGGTMVGDVAKIRFQNFTMGVGVQGLPSASRQLSGNEALSSSGYREEKISFGMHRYAVAFEVHKSKKAMPERNVQHILWSVTSWWTMQDDMDTFFTLFRDYPFYVSESQGLSSTNIDNDVFTLFGRGFNDTLISPDIIFTGDGTKGDIEPGASVTGFRSTVGGDKVGLSDTDTLTAPFLNKLSGYLGNSGIKMPALNIEDNMPFYGLLLEQQDVDYLYANSSNTFVTDLKNMTSMSMVNSETIAKHPVFSKQLGGLYQLKFFQYSQIDPKIDPRIKAPNNITESVNTIYDDLYGKMIKPEAKIIAATELNQAIIWHNVWQGGYLKSGYTRDHTHGAYQLYVSSGSDMFPYFDGGAVFGKDSINHIDAGYYADGVTPGSFNQTYVGRMQVGMGNTATTRWKVVYKGPWNSGNIKVGTDLSQVSYTEDVYKLEIIGLHRWVPGSGSFATANTITADWATFKTFLGINATTKVIDPTLVDRAYQRNRRIHMFDTVRTLVFGKSLMYKVNGEGAKYATEMRDYESFEGHSVTSIAGKKIVSSGHGQINNYLILVLKRPYSTL